MRTWFSTYVLALIVTVGLLAGCGSSQPVRDDTDASLEDTAASDTVTVDTTAAEPLDSTYVVLPLRREQFDPPQRTYDILHTALDLRVDLDQRELRGTATHHLTPLREVLDSLRFDAAGLDVALVTLTHPLLDTESPRIDTLRFAHRGDVLKAAPVEPLAPDDSVEVRITYAVEASAPTFPFGYVQPSAPTRPARAHQAWTFGFPENSQRWFPTWDYPHEMATYEVALTVPDSLSTMSLGALDEQLQVENGLRRDHWRLDAPQPAYLVSFAVGTFTATRDSLRRADGSTVPLTYYTDPAYAEEAGLIFGETPRIISVLEDKAGLRYPWPSLRQVPVRGFPAGGMEHTTNIFYFDDIQGDERAYRDVGQRMRSLLVHEIAHQWFGDLFVYENWANAALTEGFATFMESVYLEEVDGAAEGQAHRLADRATYLEAAETMRRPIIRYGYADPFEMYDAHSYQKAALVLHQLRNVVGEDVFWRGVRRYVRTNRHQNVTLGSLQRALEAEMGESLQPYFDQWFLRPGHPELRVTHTYDEADNLYRLQVEQVQDTARTGLFDFEVDIELNFYTLEPYQQRVRVNTKDTTFVFAGSSPISFLRFNAGDWLLADVRSEKPVDEWITQLRRDDEVAGRYHAVGALARQEPAKEVRDALTAAATNDAHPLIRARAAEALARYGDDSYAVRVLLERAEDDEASSVRLAALNSLEDTPDSRVLDAVRAILADETASYRVTAAAIGLIAARDSANALSTFEPLYDIDSWRDTVERALVAAIDTLKQPAGLPYLLRQLEAGKPDALVTAALDAAAPMVAEATDLHSELLDRLGHLLSARSEAVRLRTVRVLGALPDPAATDMLEQRQAVESSARVRQAIERILTERQSGKP